MGQSSSDRLIFNKGPRRIARASKNIAVDHKVGTDQLNRKPSILCLLHLVVTPTDYELGVRAKIDQQAWKNSKAIHSHEIDETVSALRHTGNPESSIIPERQIEIGITAPGIEAACAKTHVAGDFCG